MAHLKKILGFYFIKLRVQFDSSLTALTGGHHEGVAAFVEWLDVLIVLVRVLRHFPQRRFPHQHFP